MRTLKAKKEFRLPENVFDAFLTFIFLNAHNNNAYKVTIYKSNKHRPENLIQGEN
jgi:hypothetical protein